MNNEELKKKIVEILEETEYEWTEEKNGYILQIFYDKLADALIAAGVVDKSDYASMKETAVRYKAEVSKAEARAKEAEHRAEVAERALKNRAISHVSKCFPNEISGLENCVQEVYEAWIYQAEKELQEKRKE